MIRVRAWSFIEAERIDAAFFRRRIERAVALRARLPIASTGVRLVHGEADGLPGLVADRYGETLSVQFGAAGVERWKETLADALLAASGAERLYERSDAAVRGLEGLAPRTGWLRKPDTDGGDTEITITEHGWQLTLDVAHGHKTGHYLDHDNRAHFAHWVRRLGCREVLNCYSYTGGFTVAALAGGAAHVTSVDSSAPALDRVQAHVRLNGHDAAASEVADADVNAFLRAARAYKDINRLALNGLRPGGLLFSFSCSGGIDAGLFHKIAAGAAIDAGGATVPSCSGSRPRPTTRRR